jgi:hypothetical protein
MNAEQRELEEAIAPAIHRRDTVKEGSTEHKAATEAFEKLLASHPDAGHLPEDYISNMGIQD